MLTLCYRVDAVTAGHVFRRSHQVTGPDQDAYGVALADMGTGAPSTDTKPPSEPVVILNITPRSNWCVHTQPGALRRIVMNLLGNALKYTDAGFVSVSLQVEEEKDTHIKVRFRFLDSGRGMSLEFQRTKLFAPFSQEDPFSTGTGLGLSIVRQIIEAHDGHITVTSAQHVGTEVNVVMTFPVTEKVPGKTSLDPPEASTKGGTICMIDPVSLASETRPQLWSSDLKGLHDLRDTIRETCEGWFGMNVVEEPGETKPDFVLLPMIPASAEQLFKYYHDSAGSKISAPLIALCSTTGQAADFRSSIAPQLLLHGIEAIPVTQPLGPRKLAGVIERFREEHIRQRQRIVLGRKESDPEAIRRERNILRRVEEAQRAEQSQTEKQQQQQPPAGNPTSPEQTKSRRPGPSALVHMEAIEETATSQDNTPEPLESPSHNMILGRVAAENSSLRSRSAPPGGLFPAMEPTASTATATATATATDATTTPPRGRNITASVRPHILLVDDNAINLQLLVMFMRKQGLSYETASNGLLALETYQRAFSSSSSSASSAALSMPPPPQQQQSSESEATANTATTTAHTLQTAAAISRHSSPSPPPPPPFTHVLMDISMPIMDGLTSTRKIRAFEAERGIEPPSTIIALTGLASAEAQEDALDAGINQFLVKPVKFGELKGLLREPGAG